MVRFDTNPESRLQGRTSGNTAGSLTFTWYSPTCPGVKNASAVHGDRYPGCEDAPAFGLKSNQTGTPCNGKPPSAGMVAG